MSKRELVIIFLICFSLSVVFYLVLTDEPVKQNNQIVTESSQDKIAQLEKEYQQQVKIIFNDYSGLISQENYTAEQLTQIKTRLLDLKVPTKFKDLHINLVLSITRRENYLQNKDSAEQSESQRLVNQIKADYSWLND